MKRGTMVKAAWLAGIAGTLAATLVLAHGTGGRGDGWGAMHGSDEMGPGMMQGYGGQGRMAPGQGYGGQGRTAPRQGYGGPGGGYGMGPGMMGGYGHMGPGMMGGYGHMGPGMMGGYGGPGGYGHMGPGMMGGYGHMGPGMMGGYGMGPGMMGGYGPGAMTRGGIGPYEAGVLGLDDQQRSRLEAIQRESAREHWELMQEMRDQRLALMERYHQGRADPDEVRDAYQGMAQARRRMIEHQAEVRDRMREVLTEEQRERLEEMQRYRWGGGWEDQE